jgi:hypothetical protein
MQPGTLEILSVPSHEIVSPKPLSTTQTTGRRLALARWLASEENPLTARVIVNRLWQYHFGKGLVGTPNDFGRMGEAPTHPELLDWLATELVRQGWSIKSMHRLILSSSTYQQSSVSQSRNQERSENRLLEMHPTAGEKSSGTPYGCQQFSQPKAGGPGIFGSGFGYRKLPQRVARLLSTLASHPRRS